MRLRIAGKHPLIVLLLVGIAAFLVAGASDCEDSDEDSKAISQRDETFNRATQRYPVPRTENFPLRAALVKMTERQDQINHPWYVYILGMNGNVIGYYVGQTVPINACNFLSSTEKVDYDGDGGNIILTAPSLDGIFYGGAGASSGCDAWFFFDYATDALVQIRGVNFYVADQPLLLDVEPIEVQANP